MARRRSPRDGFTLIELLVVLAIIAALLTAVPRLLAGLPGMRLQAAADELAGTLRELRGAALSRHMTTELVLDPAARRYAVAAGAPARVLPDVVQRVEVSLVPAAPPEQAPRIRFFADGTATGGTIRLLHGVRSATITVDWLTGRVRRDG